MSRREEVDGLVQDFFEKHTRSEMSDLLLSARIAFGELNSMAEFSRHTQLRRWEIASESGAISIPAHPDSNRKWRKLSLPRIGEHSEAIRKEFKE
jgi:crotonobetainyl-CoA:carnitine CoA-transferase CaiB-like acyl-CoA transferase